MKLLSLHVDYIRFQALKKAMKSLPDLPEDEKGEKEAKEALVILTAVEKGDMPLEDAVSAYISEVKKLQEQVKAERIVLYPYAHLSKNLSPPNHAVSVMRDAQKQLQKEKFEVLRAPFGYYKTFELKVKGHPLSELSRELTFSGSEAVEEYDPAHLLREISKSKLDSSKLKENDHRILGNQMDLFSFNDVAPGAVFWHNNGLTIYNELIRYWREEHRKAGYEEIRTPQILDKKLWQISGHWDKYKDNIFLSDYEKRDFAVKPMNCPGGMLVYKSRPKSYRDLPLRVGEVGVVHRQELSGVLAGLFRVIQFTQDDAHIFCTEEQLSDEITRIIDIIDVFIEKFGLTFDHVELSTRPEKRIGADKVWDVAEKTLESVLKKKKMKFKINKGDGAFYGPKIDFHLKDSLGRTWQCSTIQLDFAMPERFDLEYIDKDNSRKRPVMLHRVVYGSLERFMGILLESTHGWLPTWLAPEQVRVLSFTDRNQAYAEEVYKKIQDAIPGLRISKDVSQSTVQSKVKEATLLRTPYILVVGDKEQEANSVAARVRGSNKIQHLSLEDFISQIKEEILQRK